MKQDELKEVLRLHKLWLDEDESGKSADLSGLDLRSADLSGLDLRSADLSGADLCGSDLSGSNLCEADLCGADLRGADLRESNLCGSDLSGADLEGAILKWTIGDGKRIRTLIGMKYHINIWDDMMSIGCQQHKIDEWFSFNDETIAKMDDKALEWWSANKQNIQFLVKMLSGG